MADTERFQRFFVSFHIVVRDAEMLDNDDIRKRLEIELADTEYSVFTFERSIMHVCACSGFGDVEKRRNG